MSIRVQNLKSLVDQLRNKEAVRRYYDLLPETSAVTLKRLDAQIETLEENKALIHHQLEQREATIESCQSDLRKLKALLHPGVREKVEEYLRIQAKLSKLDVELPA